jgi:hypothetical protein
MKILFWKKGSANMSIPYSLQPLETYFTRANELSGPHPYVAHHLRLFAVELAMKMKGPDANQFLLTQMDILEKEKGTVEPPLYQPPLCPDPNWKPPPPPPPPEAPPVAAAGAADASDGRNGSTADGTGASDTKPEEAAASASSSKGMFSFLSKQPPNPSLDAAKEGAANLSIAGDPKPPPSTEAPKPPMITPHKVAATPQQALRTLALDLYERGRQADKPDTFPPPSTSWGVSDAPKIARCLHSGRAVPAHSPRQKARCTRGGYTRACPTPARSRQASSRFSSRPRPSCTAALRTRCGAAQSRCSSVHRAPAIFRALFAIPSRTLPKRRHV